MDGPILIFDKSALQGLSVNESVWLDTFFRSNITPIFWVETLADLSKELRSGSKRTPEDIVGNMALKTPEFGAKLNCHHEKLVAGELLRGQNIDTRFGFPVIPTGLTVELEGKKGLVFHPTEEEEAFARWQNGEFLDLERTIAKQWRKALSQLDFDYYCRVFKKIIEPTKPRNIEQSKKIADSLIDANNQEDVFVMGMSLINMLPTYQNVVLQRWKLAGCPRLRHYAPYFCYVMSVDLCFYIAMSSGIISGQRPSHKIDLSYLYYLPFCMVFCSEDKLHGQLVPPFMRDSQVFLKGSVLKEELSKLNAHYSSLPQEIKDQGTSVFAQHPPLVGDFLTSDLWDKFLPSWRDIVQNTSDGAKKLSMEEQASDTWNGLNSITIVRRVFAERGDWKRLPPECIQT